MPTLIPGGAKLAHSDDGLYASRGSVDPPALDDLTVREVGQLVKRRKSLYRTFVTFNLIVVGLLIWTTFTPAPEGPTAPLPVEPDWWDVVVVRAQEVAKLLVPSVLERLVEVVWEYPLWSAGFIVIFATLRRLSMSTKRRMHGKAFEGWRKAMAASGTSHPS